MSVSGLRFTLFDEASLELLLSKLQHAPDLINALPHEVRQRLHITAIVNSRSPIETLRIQMNTDNFKMLFKAFDKKPPSGVSISVPLQHMLRILNILAVYSIFPEVVHSNYWSIAVSTHEPFFWCLDFFVFVCLASFNADDLSVDPVKSYIQERLLEYKRNRKIAMDCMNPRIFSLGLTSTYKNDQLSWLGVVWRSCIVAGIGIYNLWFWFTGIESLKTDLCPEYIFLFCKMNLLGGARTFFKVMSMIYGGALIVSCCTVMLAFIGTTFRSLFINFFLMPYAKVLLLLASVDSEHAKRRLENWDTTRSDFLKWLEIPNVRQLLCSFAYLSSNPKEDTDVGDNFQEDQKNVQNSAWYASLQSYSQPWLDANRKVLGKRN